MWYSHINGYRKHLYGRMGYDAGARLDADAGRGIKALHQLHQNASGG